jgi:SdrD B-like domain
MMKQRLTLLHFSNYFTIFFFFGVCLTPSVLEAQISGKVFRDINADGIYTAGEYPEAGIRVVAYNANGDSVTQVTTTATLDGSGDNYSFTGLTLPVRLEFRIRSFLFGAKGSVGNTTIQFYSAANSSADLAVEYPSLYCQNDPNVMIPCYVSGNPEGGGTGGTMDAFISFPYSTTGTSITPTHIASASQIGTVWGSAYQRESKKVVLAAFLKRHCGLEALGLGGLFVGDMTSAPGSIASYINIENFGINVGSSLIATRAALPAAATASSADPLGFDYMGKIGIGSIDLSDDGKVLWGVNLYDKTIFSFKIGNPIKAAAAVTSAGFASFPIPNPGCTNGIARPWAIEYYEGKIYVGVICSGETAGTQSNLFAYVYRFDPTTNTWDAAPVLSFALDYAKGAVHASFPAIDKWETWANAFTDLYDSGTAGSPVATRKMRPQPILSDIQFDKRGNLILGFCDRTGHQTGRNQIAPTGGTALYNGYIGGDILYFKSNGAGGFTIENNGSVTGQTGSGVGNTQGPGNGEFFAGDVYPLTGTSIHEETMQGGLFYHPSRDEIMANQMDPFSIFSGGVVRHLVANGSTSSTMRYQIYNTATANGTFGKANGLGLLEMACDAAPLEIGNRVWIDANKNGKQDAGEAGVDGVTVKLKLNGTTMATTTTTNGGQYYFANVLKDTTYTIVIETFATQTSLSNLTLTTTDVGTNGSDLIDNDAVVSTTSAVITYRTGLAGQNAHSLDFGFVCMPPTVTSITATQATCTGATANSDAAINITGITGMTKYAYTAAAGGVLSFYSAMLQQQHQLPKQVYQILERQQLILSAFMVLTRLVIKIQWWF